MARGEIAAVFKALAKEAAEAAQRISASVAKLTERTAEIEEANLADLARTDAKAAEAITAAGRSAEGTTPVTVVPSSGRTFVSTPWGTVYDIPAEYVGAWPSWP